MPGTLASPRHPRHFLEAVRAHLVRVHPAPVEEAVEAHFIPVAPVMENPANAGFFLWWLITSQGGAGQGQDWRADNPLFSLDNVVTTPHAAYYSEEAISTVRRFAAEEVVRVLTGQAPLSPVNAGELIEARWSRSP